jgi:3-hydroxybutyryl-CoA dehydrogenase
MNSTTARIGIVGLGTMGAGIAQVCIEAGFDTVAFEASAAVRETAAARIAHFIGRKVEKGTLAPETAEAALGRLTRVAQLAGLAGCDLVIEAVFEDLEVKRALLGELDAVVSDEVVLATNTSALSVTSIAAGSARPARVVGMHFFNPPPLMPLVEVVRAELTSDEAFAAAYRLAEQLGKQPVGCADTPGFLVNRMLIPLLNDCVRVLDEASVSPADLDRALEAGAGWPLGPARLLDLIGLDVHVQASEALYSRLREPRMAPPPRLLRLVEAGKLGRKSGEGFYLYSS